MKIFTPSNIMAMTYKQKSITTKEFLQNNQNNKNYTNKFLSEMANDNQLKISLDSYFKNYRTQIEDAMKNDNVLDAVEKYGEIYKSIKKDYSEDKGNELIETLDNAFESVYSEYAGAMAARITSLSSVRVKVEIPALGSGIRKDNSNPGLGTLMKLDNKIFNDIRNIFSEIKNSYHNNKDVITTNSNSLTFNDLKELSGGLLKELQEYKKSKKSDEIENDDLLKKIDKSKLSDYAKELFSKIIELKNK